MRARGRIDFKTPSFKDNAARQPVNNETANQRCPENTVDPIQYKAPKGQGEDVKREIIFENIVRASKGNEIKIA